MKSKKVLILALLLGTVWLLCGCRTRTKGGPEIILPDASESRMDETKQGESFSGEAVWTESGENGENGGAKRCTGKSAEALVIKVPRGTVVYVTFEVKE